MSGSGLRNDYERIYEMGMYTQLVLGVKLKQNTPSTVIAMLAYLVGDKSDMPLAPIPMTSEASEFFFETPRWDATLRCDSYYFDWTSRSFLDRDDLYRDKPMYYLSVTSNLKNYDGEIAKFLMWLAPYIDTNGFLGFTRYEEFDHPTLIYKWENDVIQFVQTEGPEE